MQALGSAAGVSGKGALAVQGLRKTYPSKSGERVLALDDVSFLIHEREFVAVVGPSGCGKSTLLKIFAGLLAKSEGDIALRGRPVTGPSRDVGIVFQDAVPLWDELIHGTLLANLGVTLEETAVGFALAVVFGIGLGSLISEADWARRVILPYLIALQTVPKIAIAPLLVLWFGFGMTSKIIIAAMVAVFPILINTIEGLGTTDRNRIDMVVAACGTRWQVFRIVKFPSALPFIFAGLNAGIVLALLGAVVGEFIGAHAGLGNFIMSANFRMEVATVFAVLVVLAAVGFVLHLMLVTIQRRVVFWSGPVRVTDES